MKCFFCLLIACVLAFPIGAQVISIQEARQQPEGAPVTIRGIVTNGAELGKIRFLQDGSAGIAAFPGSGSVNGFDTAVTLGDSIEVSGKLLFFNGLLEISPITGFQVISSGNPLPEPEKLQISEFSEAWEGQLIQTTCVTFEDAGADFNVQGAFGFFDEADNVSEIFLRTGSPLLGASVPVAPVEVTGILSQFGDYQVLPRTPDDLSGAACFYFSQHPEQTDIQQNSLGLQWATNLSAKALVLYGLSPSMGIESAIDQYTVEHNFTLDNLQAGSIYWVQVLAIQNGDTLRSAKIPLATRSTSSGAIEVYFSFPIDPATAGNLEPAGQSVAEVLGATISRIDSASASIDVAMYNNSRDDLTTALKNAAARGVRVRYIAATDTENYALDPPPGFPVLYGNEEALMHNKFMVIDADLPDKCWVMCGSMNWTVSNISNAYNNTLFIQDQSLARTYEAEFEEMWGGAGEAPNPAGARFGAQKTDNTPHRFVIGDIPVESYFSPSDKTNSHLIDAVATADENLVFALLTFTRNDLAEMVVLRAQQGANVRGMLENINDLGSEMDYLQSNGISVLAHPESRQLHHKYAVIDVGASLPRVATGSHNWTNLAETSNDENTLIIHDADIARLYLAEFNQRWKEQSTSLTTPPVVAFKIHPNPATDFLQLDGIETPPVCLEIWRTDGVLQQTILNVASVRQIDIRALSPGMYFIKAIFDHGIATFPFQKIRP